MHAAVAAAVVPSLRRYEESELRRYLDEDTPVVGSMKPTANLQRGQTRDRSSCKSRLIYDS